MWPPRQTRSKEATGVTHQLQADWAYYAARTSTPKVPSFIQVTNSVPEMPPLMWSRNWMTHEKWCHSSAAGGQDTAAKSKGWWLPKETSGDMSFDPGIWVTGMKIPLYPNHMPLNHSKSLLLKSCWNIAGETWWNHGAAAWLALGSGERSRRRSCGDSILGDSGETWGASWNYYCNYWYHELSIKTLIINQ